MTVRILRMRRWLAIFLLVFLPFQFSWAAVSGYCQHETDGAAQHLGHHEHKHQTDDADDAKKSSTGVDGDCLACHACCSVALTSVTTLPLVLTILIEHPWRPLALASPPQTQPERPNWAASA